MRVANGTVLSLRLVSFRAVFCNLYAVLGGMYLPSHCVPRICARAIFTPIRLASIRGMANWAVLAHLWISAQPYSISSHLSSLMCILNVHPSSGSGAWVCGREEIPPNTVASPLRGCSSVYVLPFAVINAAFFLRTDFKSYRQKWSYCMLHTVHNRHNRQLMDLTNLQPWNHFSDSFHSTAFTRHETTEGLESTRQKDRREVDDLG